MRESVTADKLLVLRGPSNQFITNKSDAQSVAWDLSWQQAFWNCNDKDNPAATLPPPPLLSFSADRVPILINGIKSNTAEAMAEHSQYLK